MDQSRGKGGKTLGGQTHFTHFTHVPQFTKFTHFTQFTQFTHLLILLIFTHFYSFLLIYLQRKNSSDDKSEDDMDEDGLRESKTTVTIQLDPTDTTNFQRVS